MAVEESAAAPVSEAEADALLAPLADGGSVALAVSGGPDSMALLALAAAWRARRVDAPDIAAMTVDHGLRPESAKEAAAVTAAAESFGLRHHALVWEGPKPASDIQKAAREARYRLMGARCRALGIGRLVTAHHLDDQAETFLLRLARGSGVDGLSAMAGETRMADGTLLVRPLLGVPKARLLATVEAAGLAVVDDPSNRAPRFARSRMRVLMPALAAEGLLPARLAATARRMARARAALERMTDDLERAAVAAGPDMAPRLDRTVLAAALEEVGLRLLARLLMKVAGRDLPPRLDRLERLHGQLVAGGGQGAFPGATLGGCRLAPEAGGAVSVRPEKGRSASRRAAREAVGA